MNQWGCSHILLFKILVAVHTVGSWSVVFNSYAQAQVSHDSSMLTYIELLKQSLVEVEAYKQKPRADEPWAYQQAFTQTYMGVVVEVPGLGPMVLTLADATLNHRQIFLKRLSDGLRSRAVIHKTDLSANLMLLRPENNHVWRGLKSLPLAEEIALGAKLDLIGSKGRRQLIPYASTFNSIALVQSGTISLALPHYQFSLGHADLTVGAPIINKGQLVGLVSHIDQGVVSALTRTQIHHFLEGRMIGHIGLSTSPLSAKVSRKYYGDDGDDGVVIIGVRPYSNFSKLLRPGDVLVRIANFAINRAGIAIHPTWGSVPFAALVPLMAVDQPIKLIIRRRGLVKEFQAHLASYDANQRLIPQYYTSSIIPFVVFSGLVFQELSLPYLHSFGRNWLFRAPSRLLFQYKYKANNFDGSKVIILNKVLADQTNIGYHMLRNGVVRSINGRVIRSLADLRIALTRPVQQHNKNYARILLEHGMGDVVLSYDDLPATNRRIAKTFKIDPKHFWSL